MVWDLESKQLSQSLQKQAQGKYLLFNITLSVVLKT